MICTINVLIEKHTTQNLDHSSRGLLSTPMGIFTQLTMVPRTIEILSENSTRHLKQVPYFSLDLETQSTTESNGTGGKCKKSHDQLIFDDVRYLANMGENKVDVVEDRSAKTFCKVNVDKVLFVNYL